MAAITNPHLLSPAFKSHRTRMRMHLLLPVQARWRRAIRSLLLLRRPPPRL